MEHAMDRALERYGLKLTYSDITDIAIACQQGYGRLTFLKGGRERHLVSFRGKALVVVYEPPNANSKSKYGDVVTILPRYTAISQPGRWHGPDRRTNRRKR